MILMVVANHLCAQYEIWGTVQNTGDYGYGYIFKTDSIGDNIQIVTQFDGANGRYPGAIMQASNGKLYGLTEKGGLGQTSNFNKGGVLYEYDPAIDSFQVLVHFNAADPVFPYDGPKFLQGLTETSPGVLYGSVAFGGNQNGYVFRFDLSSNTLNYAAAIPPFQGGAMNTTQGNRLNGPLFRASDGYLYSTTERYSQCPVAQPDQGAIIRINPNTGNFAYSYVNPCTGIDGYYYYSHFTEIGGSLYSVARLGGTANKGVIYQYTPSTNTFTKKHDFQGGVSGELPTIMILATNGKFYGLASGGATETYLPSGGGIIFEFDPVLNVYTKKIDFSYGNGWIGNVGPFPSYLISSQNGKLYGTTGNGVFEYNVQTNSTRAAGRFYPIGGNGQVSSSQAVEICRFPNYTFSANTDFMICDGSDFTYDLESDNTTSVVWKQNGIISPLQTSTILSLTDVSANDAGTWTAELTNECGTTVTQAIQINLVPEINVTQINNSLEVTSGGDNFQWIDCATQMPLDGETSVSFTPAESGSYAVAVTNGPCTDTSECYPFLALSLGENMSNTIALYPNPVNDILHLTGDMQIQSVTICNALGQLVLNKEIIGQHIDVSELTEGLYFVSAQTNKGVWKGKFVKR